LRTRANPWIGQGISIGTYGDMKTTLNVDDTVMAELKREGTSRPHHVGNGPIGAAPTAHLVPHQTGGAGYIGGHMVHELTDAGERVGRHGYAFA
jgi:hypothetical protein